jgi:hypothetical protein
VVIAVEQLVAVASLDRLEVGPLQHDYQPGAALLLGLREKETRKGRDKREKRVRRERRLKYITYIRRTIAGSANPEWFRNGLTAILLGWKRHTHTLTLSPPTPFSSLSHSSSFKRGSWHCPSHANQREEGGAGIRCNQFPPESAAAWAANGHPLREHSPWTCSSEIFPSGPLCHVNFFLAHQLDPYCPAPSVVPSVLRESGE